MLPNLSGLSLCPSCSDVGVVLPYPKEGRDGLLQQARAAMQARGETPWTGRVGDEFETMEEQLPACVICQLPFQKPDPSATQVGSKTRARSRDTRVLKDAKTGKPADESDTADTNLGTHWEREPAGREGPGRVEDWGPIADNLQKKRQEGRPLQIAEDRDWRFRDEPSEWEKLLEETRRENADPKLDLLVLPSTRLIDEDGVVYRPVAEVDRRRVVVLSTCGHAFHRGCLKTRLEASGPQLPPRMERSGTGMDEETGELSSVDMSAPEYKQRLLYYGCPQCQQPLTPGEWRDDLGLIPVRDDPPPPADPNARDPFPLNWNFDFDPIYKRIRPLAKHEPGAPYFDPPNERWMIPTDEMLAIEKRRAMIDRMFAMLDVRIDYEANRGAVTGVGTTPPPLDDADRAAINWRCRRLGWDMTGHEEQLKLLLDKIYTVNGFYLGGRSAIAQVLERYLLGLLNPEWTGPEQEARRGLGLFHRVREWESIATRTVEDLVFTAFRWTLQYRGSTSPTTGVDIAQMLKHLCTTMHPYINVFNPAARVGGSAKRSWLAELFRNPRFSRFVGPVSGGISPVSMARVVDLLMERAYENLVTRGEDVIVPANTNKTRDQVHALLRDALSFPWQRRLVMSELRLFGNAIQWGLVGAQERDSPEAPLWNAEWPQGHRPAVRRYNLDWDLANDGRGWSALHYAAATQGPEVMSALLSWLPRRAVRGVSPRHWPLQGFDILDQGTGSTGQTPLSITITREGDVTPLLMEQDEPVRNQHLPSLHPSLTAVDTTHAMSPMHLAVWYQDLGSIRRMARFQRLRRAGVDGITGAEFADEVRLVLTQQALQDQPGDAEGTERSLPSTWMRSPRREYPRSMPPPASLTPLGLADHIRKQVSATSPGPGPDGQRHPDVERAQEVWDRVRSWPKGQGAMWSNDSWADSGDDDDDDDDDDGSGNSDDDDERMPNFTVDDDGRATILDADWTEGGSAQQAGPSQGNYSSGHRFAQRQR